MEATRTMQPTRGCNSFDMDSEVVVVGGILSPMPEGIIPKPESLPFVTVGGAKLRKLQCTKLVKSISITSSILYDNSERKTFLCAAIFSFL